MFGKVINTFLTDAPCVFTIFIFTLLHETDFKKKHAVFLRRYLVGSHFSVVIRTTDIQRVPFRKKRGKKGADERATFSIKNDI